MHNALTWVQVSVTALQSMPVHWLIFEGVYLLWRQRKERRQKYYIQMLFHWLLFSGVSYCDNRERVVMFDYDTKEKEHKTLGNLIYTQGLRPLVQIRYPRVSVLFLLRRKLKIYFFARVRSLIFRIIKIVSL
jgi:hypothetical protein